HAAWVVTAAPPLAAAHRDLAAGGGFEAHGDGEPRRCAAARWADEHNDLAVVHFEAHAAERLHGVHRAIDTQRELLGYIVQGDFTHAAHHLSRRHRPERVTKRSRRQTG